MGRLYSHPLPVAFSGVEVSSPGSLHDSHPPWLSPGPGPVWVEEISSPEVASGLGPTAGWILGMGWVSEWGEMGSRVQSGLFPGTVPSG